MQRWEELALEREDGKAEGKAEGKTEGKAEDILELLGELGDVPEDIAERVWKQKEDQVLRRWLRLAARAAGIEEFRKEINMAEGNLAD